MGYWRPFFLKKCNQQRNDGHTYFLLVFSRRGSVLLSERPFRSWECDTWALQCLGSCLLYNRMLGAEIPLYLSLLFSQWMMASCLENSQTDGMADDMLSESHHRDEIYDQLIMLDCVNAAIYSARRQRGVRACSRYHMDSNMQYVPNNNPPPWTLPNIHLQSDELKYWWLKREHRRSITRRSMYDDSSLLQAGLS